jgi:hypothetical protein
MNGDVLVKRILVDDFLPRFHPMLPLEVLRNGYVPRITCQQNEALSIKIYFAAIARIVPDVIVMRKVDDWNCRIQAMEIVIDQHRVRWQPAL